MTRPRRWCRRCSVVFAAAIVLATACSENVTVGRDEAIEVLVLDGVSRERARCIVDGVDGIVGLAKVTGIDPDLTEGELADLARVSSSCVFVDETSFEVVEGEPEELDEEEGDLEFDIDAEVERLVNGGIAPEVAKCVGVALSVSSDPAIAADSDSFLTETLRICDP